MSTQQSYMAFACAMAIGFCAAALRKALKSVPGPLSDKPPEPDDTIH